MCMYFTTAKVITVVVFCVSEQTQVGLLVYYKIFQSVTIDCIADLVIVKLVGSGTNKFKCLYH